MAASITTLAKKIRNTKQRQANVFIDTTSDGLEWNWRNMGRVKDISFEAEPVESDADQDGRTSVQLYDVTIAFTMLQASNEELSMIPELAMPDATNYPNGHRLYFSGSAAITTADMNGLTRDADEVPTDAQTVDPDGIGFVNAILKPSPSIPMGGENSVIVVEVTARIGRAAYENLDTNPFITLSAE